MIAALLETGRETRVAITPHSAKQLIKLGFEVAIEKNSGLASDFSNEEYQLAGAQVIDNKKELLKQTNILLFFN